jgi:hypothetical protein
MLSKNKFYRREEIAQKWRHLPPDTYNKLCNFTNEVTAF